MSRLIRCGCAAALALAVFAVSGVNVFAQSVFEWPGYFTFEVSAVVLPRDPSDPNYAVLQAFADGSIDRYTHWAGGYNSLAGAVRLSFRGQVTEPYGQFRPYPGCFPVQFQIWNTTRHGIEQVRILDSAGDHQAQPRAKTYTNIPGFADPDYIFDLRVCGTEAMIALPDELLTTATKAQWCAPTFVDSLRPTPAQGIPYTAREINWHLTRSRPDGGRGYDFTTTFILAAPPSASRSRR